MRFIPYPVMGGFLAGTGWLLSQGSIGIMTQVPLALENLHALVSLDQLVLWVPGVIFALILFFGMRRSDHFLSMPGIIVGAFVLFYLVLLVTGTSIPEAVDRGYLLGEASGEPTWSPLGVNKILSADWVAILGQTGNIATILVLSVVALLVNSTAFELDIEQDIDINHELRSAGVANILSGLFGGMVGYHALSLSKLTRNIGARGRLAGLIAGGICALVLIAKTSLLAFFPKMILGGLLLWAGLAFLFEWVIEGWKRLSRADYVVVVTIMIVIAATDYLIGMGVGLVVMVILFVVNYSRVDVIHHALSGAEMKSNVERHDRLRRDLKKLGGHIQILELRGFIFFGTANELLDQIRIRVRASAVLPVRYVILDFRRVRGLDSSAIFSFIKCRQLAETRDIILVFTDVTAKIQSQLESGGLLKDQERVRIFPDLDRGLEWCEEQLLQMSDVTRKRMPHTLRERLVENGFEVVEAARMLDYIEKYEVTQGQYLIRQGDDSEDVFFIEWGRLTIYLELEDGDRIRLQTIDRRAIVGELGLYLGERRTASVVADEPCVTYRLSKESLAKMKLNDPDLVAALHEYVARMLAERLADTTRLIAALNE
jgi:SulP family sulfate permease